jgi:hypothetical protein
MQVLVDDLEYRRIQRLARRRGMTLAEWVRQALRAACREEPLRDPEKKLAAIRSAARHEFPTADVERMLEQIEHGYREERTD